VRELDLDLIDFDSSLSQALAAQKLTEQQASLVKAAHIARMDAIQVDDFDPKTWQLNTTENTASKDVEAA